VLPLKVTPFCLYDPAYYFLWLGSEETVSLVLPLALLLARIFLPLTLDILSLKPCLFFFFLLDGWNVLFISFDLIVLFCLPFLQKSGKYTKTFSSDKKLNKKTV